MLSPSLQSLSSTLNLLLTADEAETKEAGFSFNFAFEQQQKGDLIEATEISHEKKNKKKKKPKKKNNNNKTTGTETAGEAQGAMATSGFDSSSSDDEPDALLYVLKKPSKQVAQPATKGKLPHQPQPQPQPRLDKPKSKKGIKGKRTVEVADDEDWFDPQPQNHSRPLATASSDKSVKNVGGSVFIRSAKDPKLLAGNPLAVQRVKFGDGKNLVAAIGPPKVKNSTWAARDFTGAPSQLDHTSSPFAFGFAFGSGE